MPQPLHNQPSDAETSGTRRWVLVLMALALPPAIWGLGQIRLKNDIRNWMPPDDPSAMALKWYGEHFPQNESVLVSWDGSTLNDPRIGWLADRLQGVADEDDVRHGGLQHVARVVTPTELVRKITDDGVEHDAALDRLKGLLIGTGPLKLKLTELGKRRKETALREIKKAIAREFEFELEVSEPVSDWTEDLAEDPGALQIPRQIVEQEELEPFPAVKEHDLQLSWDSLHRDSKEANQVIELVKSINLPDSDEPLVEDAFFAPGSPVTVAVVLSEAGEADKKGSIREIRRIAGEVGIPVDDLHLGGRPVAGAALNASVKKVAWDRSQPLLSPRRSIGLFSGIVGIALAFIMLRSVILALLVLVVSYYTVFVTVAIVPFTGGSMNMVLVVMPTLLLVLTMSGAIHVANYWRFAARDNHATAATSAAEMASRPCFLASLTTAFGLLSLTTSPLKPVADFGLYSAIGCFVGLGAILFGLPAILRFVPKRVARTDQAESTLWPAIARWIHSKATLVAAVCLLAFVGSSLGLFHFRTETKVIKFFPKHTQVSQDYQWMERNIGGVVNVDVVLRFSDKARLPAETGMLFAARREVVRRVQDAMVAEHPDITGAISLATFAPVQDAEALAAKANSRIQLKLDSAAETKMKEDGADSRKFLSEATKQADWKEAGDGRLARAGDELWRITAQVNILTDVDYSILTKEVDKIIRREVRNHPGVDHVVTGTVPLFLETQQAVLRSLIESFLIAFVVIGCVISRVLKNAWAGLLTMLPNVLPISTVFGAISWYGIAVDIGTMITASVALGIAVDGTLHLLTWFRQGIRQGKSRETAIADALGHCGPALCQTSIAVGMGLLVLMPAELTLVSRFGWLMAAMIGTALVADVILLPALLSGILGDLIERTDESNERDDGDSDSPSGSDPFGNAPESTTSNGGQDDASDEHDSDTETDSAPSDGQQCDQDEAAEVEVEPIAKQGPPEPHISREDAKKRT